jgi:hypothetical protein
MEHRLVTVRTYGSRVEAELARGLLEACGIPSYVSADDAGGMRPSLQLVLGVRLIVRAIDLPLARRILAGDDPGDERGGEGRA